MSYFKTKAPILSLLVGLALGGLLFFSTSATTVEKSNSETIDQLYGQLEDLDQQIIELEDLKVSETVTSEPMIGEIATFAGNFPPRGWAFCNGQELPINTNTALFSILGTIYGGDGRTTFKLPDLQGKVVVGTGNAPGGDSYTIGKQGRIKSKIIHHDSLEHDSEIFTKGTDGYQVVNYIIALQGTFPSRS